MNEWLINLPEDDATFLARLAMGFVLCLGAIIGSFLNVCIYRIPMGQSVSTPRSHCFGCGKTIPWYYNIPVLAWLVLRGKCAYCKRPISVRYPMIEALTAVLFLLVFQMWGNPTLFALNKLQLPELIPLYWLFVSSVVVNVMIDYDHGILLDRISIGGALIALAASAAFPAMQGELTWLPALLDSLLGLAVGFGTGFAIAFLGEKIFLQDAFGFGDVKWMAMFGALFGWRGVLIILFLAVLAGLFMIPFVLLANRLKKDKNTVLTMPFGPALGLGALAWLFWGNRLTDLAFWLLGFAEYIQYALLPVILVMAVWLGFRIRAIRRAVREEEAAEAARAAEADAIDRTKMMPIAEETQEDAHV